MSMKASRKTQQMTADEIATIAVTGVARALAARQAAGVALSDEELSQVNGGVLLNIMCTWGMFPLPVEV